MGMLRWALLFVAAGLLLAATALRSAPIFPCIAVGVALLGVRHVLPRGPARHGWRSVWASTALCTVSIGLALTVLEVGARLLLPPEPPAHADYLMPDPEAIFTLKPHTHMVYDNRKVKWRDFDEFTIDISREGLRDKEHGAKKDNEYRILLLGDSHAFGYGVQAPETISQRLEEDLQEVFPGRSITVINGGVPMYGPWQERILLCERGFPLEPDLVILQVFPTNDLYDSLAKVGKCFRAYHLPTLERLQAWRNKGLWPVRLQRWLRIHSATYQQLVRITGRENLLTHYIEALRFVPRMAPLVLPPREDRTYRLEVSLRQWYPEIEEAWEIFKEDVRAIQSDCQARGVDFMAFCMPPVHAFHDKYWQEWVQPLGEQAYERGKDVRITEAFFREACIPYVSVNDALSDHKNARGLYFRFNKHPTTEGTKVIAGILRDYLVRVYFPGRPS